MIGGQSTADNGSVAVNGPNQGTIYNIQGLHLPAEKQQLMSKYLGVMVAQISLHQLSEYECGPGEELGPEVADKLQHNYLSNNDPIVRLYSKYYRLLMKAYAGAEQVAADTRFLIKNRAGSIYSDELAKLCAERSIPGSARREFARDHAYLIIERVKQRMIDEHLPSNEVDRDIAVVDMAASLLVADAIAVCAVLDKP